MARHRSKRRAKGGAGAKTVRVKGHSRGPRAHKPGGKSKPGRQHVHSYRRRSPH